MILFLVPTLGDRPALLERSLTSVSEQQLPGGARLDLVVVSPTYADLDDVVRGHGARLVRDPGTGLSGALNAGLAAGSPDARYVAWLGDDDLLTQGSLRATVAALEEDADAVLAYGWCDYVDERDRVVFRSRAGRIADRIIRFGPNLVPQPGSLMRYADVVAVGGLDESVRLAMDLDLFLRLRDRGRFAALPQTLARFRWHPDSATVSNGAASMEESDQVRMRYMSRPGAAVYRYARWPGRWALTVAKARADRNARRPR